MERGILSVIIVFGIVLISMILHELAHGLMALFLGDETAKEEGRLTLNPLVHLDPFTSLVLPISLFLLGGPVFGGAKPVPINTRNVKGGAAGMALVALAGPLTNFLLAFVAFFLSTKISLHQSLMPIASNFVMINLGFFVFNLLPIPPLDGSRVIYALAPDGVRNFMAEIEQRFGIWVVFGLVMVFGTVLSTIMSNSILAILNFFTIICS